MAARFNVGTDLEICEARSEVLELLRKKDPSFLNGIPDGQMTSVHQEIAERFLSLAASSAFAVEIVALDDENHHFEGRWTHNGAVFVGFKQPPAAVNRGDAAILACAALLRNDWCRSKLPQV
jgi:hypothetical protein